MADNVSITAGSGTTIAADDIGGVLHQRVKLSQGADGAATDVSAAAPLNVTLANTGANSTPIVVDLGANNDVSVNAGTNYIGKVRLTDGTTDGEVVPLAGYNAQAVAIVDGSGSQITSFGGGVQYTEGDTDTSITGTAMMFETNTGTSALGVVSATNPLPISDNGSSITVDGTVAVSGTVTVGSHAVTNAGTFVVQENGAALTSLQLIDDAVATTASAITTKGIAISGTDGTNARIIKTDASGELQVDVLTMPTTTVTGTVTANLAAGTNNIGDVDVLTINGVAPAFGSGVRGATVQRVTIATDDVVPVTDNSGSLTVDAPVGTPVFVRLSDGSSAISTLPVSMATNTPVGNVAHDAVDSGAPIKIGARARSSEITAVASDDRSDLITDLVGKLITLPYANPENFVSGAITTAMTGTTSTSLVAAPGAGLRNYITTIIVSNAHATVGTDIVIQDGSGGTTLMTIPAAAVYGGAVINLPVPLRQPTTNTAIFCANVTTGASTKVSAVGYKGV